MEASQQTRRKDLRRAESKAVSRPQQAAGCPPAGRGPARRPAPEPADQPVEWPVERAVDRAGQEDVDRHTSLARDSDHAAPRVEGLLPEARDTDPMKVVREGVRRADERHTEIGHPQTEVLILVARKILIEPVNLRPYLLSNREIGSPQMPVVGAVGRGHPVDACLLIDE